MSARQAAVSPVMQAKASWFKPISEKWSAFRVTKFSSRAWNHQDS